MGISVNFSKAKRNYMSVNVEESITGDETIEKTILVAMPKKRIFESLMNLKNTIPDNVESNEESSMQALEKIYQLVADILSNNLKNEKFSAEWVGDTFSIEEIKEIMAAYTSFCKGESSAKN